MASKMRSNNPFDSDEFMHISEKNNSAATRNPFDDMFKPISPSSGHSSAGPRVPLTKLRAESKDSANSGGAGGSSSSTEDEDDDDEEEEDDQEYGPDSLNAELDRSGRNHALIFMEMNPPQRCECRLLVQEDGTKFEFAASQCWMRAQRRKDGLKRLAPSVNVSIWLNPILLVAHRRAGGDDANLSFTDMMRELESAESMEGDVAVKHDSVLRLGKLRGNSRQTMFQLSGTGKSPRKAIGAMDARPEFMGLKFERGISVLALPASRKQDGLSQPINPRPLRKKDYLLKRMDSKRGEPVRKLTGIKGNNIWVFHEQTETLEEIIPDIRITKRSNEEYVCEFKGVSPLVVFALGIIIHIKSSALLSTGQSWSALLPRRSSLRWKSFTELNGV